MRWPVWGVWCKSVLERVTGDKTHRDQSDEFENCQTAIQWRVSYDPLHNVGFAGRQTQQARLICVSVFGFHLLLEVRNRLSLIRVVMKFNPIHLRHGLSSKSLSDWPLDPPHTHTHCSTFMQEIEISQADTQAWTKCQPQATGTQKEPMLIITEEKSHCFTCETCHPGYLWIMKSFSLFPCGHARGDNFNEWVYKSSD